jgi:hypothetical protein
MSKRGSNHISHSSDARLSIAQGISQLGQSHDVGFAHMSSGLRPDYPSEARTSDGRSATTSWLRHDARDLLGSSPSINFRSVQRPDLWLKARSTPTSNISLIDLPLDIFHEIFKLLELAEFYILQFVSKTFLEKVQIYGPLGKLPVTLIESTNTINIHKLIKSMIHRGDLAVLEWMLLNLNAFGKSSLRNSTLMCFISDEAALGGQLKILKWVSGLKIKVKCFCVAGITTFKNAAKKGNIKILKWLQKEFYCDVEGLSGYFTRAVCDTAALFGHLDVLKWAKKNNYIFSVRTSLNAAHGGYLDILKFIEIECGTTFGWVVCSGAALGGHLEVLKWARQNGYPWGDKTSSNASESGHFGLLKWLAENKCHLSDDICLAAVKHGNLKVLKWARENGCLWDENTCSLAAENGHFELLKWARENNCPWDEMSCSAAAKNGHFNILKWLRENGCPWDEATCSWASTIGHFTMLKWARENGCPWNEETCSAAAKHGRLDILKWAREKNCPWNGNTCTFAAAWGHFEILKWAVKNGCPWDELICLNVALIRPSAKLLPEGQTWREAIKPGPSPHEAQSQNDSFDILKLIKKNKHSWDKHTFEYAIRGGNLDILKRLKEEGCPWDEKTSHFAAKQNMFDILKWLVNNGCPVDMSTYIYMVKHGYMNMARWIKKNILIFKLTGNQVNKLLQKKNIIKKKIAGNFLTFGKLYNY